MHSLFGTARGSNPGPFDLKSDTDHYSSTPIDYRKWVEYRHLAPEACSIQCQQPAALVLRVRLKEFSRQLVPGMCIPPCWLLALKCYIAHVWWQPDWSACHCGSCGDTHCFLCGCQCYSHHTSVTIHFHTNESVFILSHMCSYYILSKVVLSHQLTCFVPLALLFAM